MVRTDARQRLAPFISVVVGVMAAVATIGVPALAAPVVGGTGSFSFDEASPAVNIGAGITIAGGGDYGGKFIEFAVNGATSTEVLSFTASDSPVTTNGSVSIVGSTVFLGNGTGADAIGRVDPVLDGTAGKALRVLFDVDFVNPSFETGDLTGWTALNQQIDLGVTQLAGCTSADTTTYSVNTTGADNRSPIESGEFSSSILSTSITLVMRTSA